MSSTPNILLKPSDYAVVAATLILSAGIGIYHGRRNKHHQQDRRDQEGGGGGGTAEEHDRRGVQEYFLAGRNMSLIPVALSFFATSCSTLSVIGPTMEVYAFGMFFAWYVASFIPVALVVTEVFVPFFYKMRSVNIYKFLELRFNRRMKEVITIFATLRAIMLGSAVIYGTSVTLSQVTNIDIWIIIGTITGVCVIYTTLGGIRGVMWTDVFQGVLMLSGIVVLVGVGTYHVGGVANVWTSNYDTGRLDIFVFDLDPRTRHTFWSDFVGFFFALLSFFVTTQANVHRFLTAPSIEDAKRSSYLGFSIQALLIFLTSAVGCIMYAEFYHCDPLTAKTVQNMNQLIPIFVSNVLEPYPILPGLFLAGLLSACLSTLSSVFNSVAAILMETFIEPQFPNIAAKHSTTVCQLLGIFVGLLNTICVLIARRFPNVLQGSISCTAALDGPLLGILLVGVFIPRATVKVVATAFLGGVLSTLWIVVGTLVVNKPLTMKPMFTDGCSNDTHTIDYYAANISRTITVVSTDGAAIADSSWEMYFPLHDVTYQWLAMIGLIVFIFLFAVLSTVFGMDESNDLKFDPADFIPMKVQRFQRRLQPRRSKRGTISGTK